jgi:uncharacterized protein
MVEAKFVEQIAAELTLNVQHVSAAIHLLDGGATTPFIARYRKDAVGNLDETQLETIADRAAYFMGVMNRRKNIVETISKQGGLTDELQQKIEACQDRVILEDLYLPFKPRRPNKATMAMEQGLAPLADFILKQYPGLQILEEFAEGFVKPEKSISSPQEAIEGALYILAERFAMDPDSHAALRERMLEEGMLTVRATKNAEGTKTKFEAYYSFAEPVAKVSSHRMLAILRGANDGFLRVDITMDEERMFNALLARYVTQPGSIFEQAIRTALHEAYTRHLRPYIENEVLEILRKRAEEEAIRMCRDNARNLLLFPPAGPINVLGIIYAPKVGFKVAAVDGSGTCLEHQTIPFEESQNGSEAAEQALTALMEKHAAYTIAIGNGTGSREAARFINGVLAKKRNKGAFIMLINATPASSYASSRLAREELPDLDTGLREAVAVARRLQDPLAELVKVEPRAIGVGQYQHDVNQKQLREGLCRTLVSCVSRVGVDLNSAPAELLRYVSGLQMGTAQNIVETRKKLDGFKARSQLVEVDGIGPKVFEQCAGFLRVAGAENPLDSSGIHPEAYPVVEQIAQNLNVPVKQLIGNAALLARVDFAGYQTETVGPLALADIREELIKPAADPRGQFRLPRFLEGLSSIEDLHEGMETEGVVTNVTDFGAFVDVGVQQDGLVHLSELSRRFIKDPRAVIKAGEVVRVKVIKVDKETPRISLSMKAVQARPRRRSTQRTQPQAKPRPTKRPHPDAAQTKQTPGRAPAGTRPREESEEMPRPRGARPERRERGRDRDRGTKREDRRTGRTSKRPERDRASQKPVKYADSSGPLNTLLADQLAALRNKFNS